MLYTYNNYVFAMYVSDLYMNFIGRIKVMYLLIYKNVLADKNFSLHVH